MNERQQRYYNEFRERVEAQGGTVITRGWRNAHTPMLIRCRVGHLAMPRPNNVQKGHRICRACAGTDPVYAQWGFRERVEEQGGVVLEPTWLGNHTPHRIRCAEGHETTVQPGHVQQGRGICRFCAYGSDRAWGAFRSAVAGHGGEVLEPEWLGNHTPHRVRCAEGHKTTVRPNSVRNGQGICRYCASGADQAWENFRNAVAGHGGEVLEPAWLGALAPHRIRCAEGHEATVRPADVQQGQGICRYCAGRVWNVFYIVADDDNDVIKFGISSGDPRARLADHRADGFEREVMVRTNFPEARELETRIIRALADAGEQPVRGREYFPARVLATVLDIAGHGAGAA